MMDGIIAALAGAVAGALLTGILGVIAYQYQQRRSNRIVVKILSQSPQITFEDSVQQKLEMIYNGTKVKNMVLTQFVIFNQGSNAIKPVKLTVNVKPKADNFTYTELNVSDPQEITVSSMDNLTGSFVIERPYLNPKKKYTEEEIKVSVFSDVLLDFSVSGSGEDWGSKLVRREELGKRGVLINAIFGGAGFLLVGILTNIFYAPFSDVLFGTTKPIFFTMSLIVATLLILAAGKQIIEYFK